MSPQRVRLRVGATLGGSSSSGRLAMTLSSLRCCAAMIAACVLVTSAAPMVHAEQQTAAAPAQPSEDFYAKRASTILENEDPQPKPHPMAASQPGNTVVVCEAGCRSGAEIVYAAPRERAVIAATASESETTSTTATCVAGC